MAGLSYSTLSSAAVALLALAGSASAQDGAYKLPNGASSLQETYQDWSLACQGVPQIVCTVSQQQTQQNGQRVMAIELRRNGDGTLAGNLVLPFGLALEAGVVLQIDDAAPQKPLRFSTCLPGGCLVPLNFDAKAVIALKTSAALKVKAQGMDTKELALPISLKGLAAALDRLAVLGNS